MFIYSLREGEREHKPGRGRERGRQRIWRGFCADRQRAWCGALTQEPRDHDLSRSWTLNPMRHPGAPESVSILFSSHYFLLGTTGTFSYWMPGIGNITRWLPDIFVTLYVFLNSVLRCSYWGSLSFMTWCPVSWKQLFHTFYLSFEYLEDELRYFYYMLTICGNCYIGI